jgi:hypothetical protein
MDKNQKKEKSKDTKNLTESKWNKSFLTTSKKISTN